MENINWKGENFIVLRIVLKLWLCDLADTSKDRQDRLTSLVEDTMFIKNCRGIIAFQPKNTIDVGVSLG